MVPIDATPQQQVVSAVAECGMAQDSFSVDIDGGGDIYVFVRSPDLSDTSLRCLSASERRKPYPIVLFETESITRRYQRFQNALARQESREWLRDHGKLAGIPEFNPNAESLDQFARKLEGFCGFQLGVVLKVVSPTLLSTQGTWNEETLAGRRSPGDEQRFECLLNAIWASNLGEHKIGFGFIGNEAVTPKP